MQLVWLVLHNPARARQLGGADDYDLPAGAVYTPEIIRQLDDLVESKDPRVWKDALLHMNGHVFALALIEEGAPISLCDPLTVEELHVHDFWKMTRWKEDVLIRVRFVEVAPFDEEVLVQQSVQQARGKGLFFNLSSFSYDKLLDEYQRQGEGDLIETIRGWARRHNIDYNSLVDGHGRFLLGMNMPVPHCILATVGTWTSWAFPLPADKRVAAGLGLKAAKPLLRSVDVAQAQREATEFSRGAGAAETSEMMTASGLHFQLNTLRRIYLDHPNEALRHMIEWLTRRRNHLLEQQLQAPQGFVVVQKRDGRWKSRTSRATTKYQNGIDMRATKDM